MKALLYKDTFPRLVADMREHPGKWLSRVVFLLGPWVCLWMVEILNQNNIFEDLDDWQVLMNMVWYYSLFLVCRLVLGRNRRSAALAAVLSFLVGLLNHYILRFRGRILFPADISGWRTAANVAGGFDYSFDQYIVQAAVLLVAYLFLVWMCVPQRKRAKIPLLWSLILWAAIGGYSYAFFCTGMLPALDIYTQQWVTQRNGFLLNFTVALRYSSVDKPKDYSEEAVLELMEEYPATEGDASVTRPVNIVAIMNESFADFSVFDTFEASEDPLPFLHSLEENTIKGWMYSPVTGGGTASVEFEYLTGFSTLFQPPHTVAYQLYVEEGMPSLAALAGTQGYETTAFHPYKSSGWNRVLAYQYLDFDHQMYEEDVENGYYIRHYVSDLSDYQTIFKSTEREDSTFFFNVTMQNHSGYAQGWNNLERSIQLPGALKKADSTAEQYFALSVESDKALEELLNYYSGCEEPTLVVFFGDHQPPLKNAFYEELYGKPLAERTTEEVLRQYAVPFFIWANYDIEERQNVVISPNYLGVLTAQTAGLPLTGYMNFLAQMYQELPAITPVGFVTGDGRFVEEKELDAGQQEWLRRYEILNYCGMVDLFDEARPMFCAGGETGEAP
ncbi:LTA synthase family protein [Pseudoflavonifractor phocaeensis]|uniref:LTA synthase family protein n=1 Tax=Pseudoflavonifractor phocaeensis TaxID=1870988 RepID=UPI001F344290|nr:LTA synthase family protein [Pseudoflavonifractor phocaeensis]MCF2596061.1 LTA synthase family protein [Pseudoflavonifractor phocaeensis]